MSYEFITLPKNAKDITNQRFGRLVTLGPVGQSKSGNVIWLCKCDCGNTKNFPGGNLKRGHAKSCGCLPKEIIAQRNTVHGMRSDPLYQVWGGMKNRCTNPNTENFAYWGGRGITVCNEWRHDFVAFHDHVSQLPHCGEKGRSLDRIDNSLGYQPGNVRWATAKEQGRNTRVNILITHNGKTQCLSAWAEELGLSLGMLHQRIRAGWSARRMLTTSARITRRPQRRQPNTL